MRALLLLLAMASFAQASAMDEVNHWRKKNGLRPFIEVPWMTTAAQKKAEWRAARLLKRGHQGPACPRGCREGTGTGTPSWGWITCCMNQSGKYAGAGIALGVDGKRRMVLIVYGRGKDLVHGTLRAQKTAHLTPHPPIIARVK